MANHHHAFLLGVGSDLLQVEVFGRCYMVESIFAAPMLPAGIPSFKNHPLNTMPCCKVDAMHGIFVVAPCRAPAYQVWVPKCMPHQTPMYFIGLIHVTSSMSEGSFRFKIMLLSTKAAAEGLI
jgi:hypothetical protein